MKAATFKKYGPPERLEIAEVEKPTPRNNELLVKVHAATVTRTDCGFLRAKPFVTRFFSGLLTPNQTILGEEFAGEIEAVGNDVIEFQVGDRVFGYDSYGDARIGAQAEYTVIAADAAVTTIPDGLSYEKAAPSNEGVHYAYMCIQRFNITPETKVLINGATGGIGSAAVQLCDYFDAEITAVCDEPRSDLVRSLGADRIIDYTKEDFTETAPDAAFDVVFDAVGKSSVFKCRRLLNPGGIFTATELGPYLSNPLLAVWTRVFGSFRDIKVLFPIPTHSREDIEFFKQRIIDGDFTPVIDRTYPLDDIVDAYRYVENGEKTGNVVITV